MKKIIFSALILLTIQLVQAQTHFFGKVKVEFEKTLNVHASYKSMSDEWFEQIKERLPKEAITYHQFIGDSTKSVYIPGKEAEVDPRSWYRPVADKNIVFTDYRSGKTIAQKPVFEEIFLMEDSLVKIKWRITPDTRMIAGYECRKAIGILADSIAIFAFYTDELMISGGPEGIHGLPGMILGVGIPRLHATWFATKVDVFDVNMNIVMPATKGKKVDRPTMMKSLDKVLRQWGEYGGKLIVNFAI
jgi:GLPGLI family protein